MLKHKWLLLVSVGVLFSASSALASAPAVKGPRTGRTDYPSYAGGAQCGAASVQKADGENTQGRVRASHNNGAAKAD